MKSKNKIFGLVLLCIAVSFSMMCATACVKNTPAPTPIPTSDAATEKNVYELYKEKYPEYKGTEEEWLKDLLDGKLGITDNTAYNRYKEKHPEYDGTKEEWLNDLLDGNLGCTDNIAYDRYKEKYPEYNGSKEEWLKDLLDGNLGIADNTAYDRYKEKYPEYDGSKQEWLNDLLDGKLGNTDNTAYDRYKEKYPKYEGNEEQWLSDLLNGKLSNPENTAYDLYKEKYPDYEGDEEQWLKDLLDGKLGNNADTPVTPEKNVYELYKEKYPDYKGTEEQWLKDLLDGKLGNPEKSAYDIYKEKFPNYKGTEEQWFNDLFDGKLGTPKKSAYDIYKEKFPNYKGTEEQWFNDLFDGKLGTPKKSTYDIYKEKFPNYKGTEEQWFNDLFDGKLGTPKKSAYDIYKEKFPNYKGTEEQWFNDLFDGKLGTHEKTAYELYKEKYPNYKGTEEEWLKELLSGDLGRKKTFTVTFLLEKGGKTFTSQSVNEFDTPTLPGTPTKTGYKFVAWTYDGYEWPFTYPITQDTVLTASWKPIQYNVTYHLNGGINSDLNPADYTIEKGFTPAAPEKLYYDFAGWYSSADFSEGSRVTSVVAGNIGNIELWAKWTPTEYSISYIGIDGASFNSTEIPSYNYESDDFTLPTVSKEHYIFAGWTCEDIAEPQLNVVIPKGTHGDLQYTANWTPVNYTITYELNGGTNSPENLIGYTIESFAGADSIPLFDPQKADIQNLKNYAFSSLTGNFDISYTVSSFAFNGWYDVNDTAKNNRITEIKLSDGNITLVADWIETEGEQQNKVAPYYRNGNELWMGSYPQSKVTDEALLAELKAYEFDKNSVLRLNPTGSMYSLIGDAPEGWTKGDKFWYKDVVHNGQKYRALFVVASRDGSYSQEQSGFVPATGTMFGYGLTSDDVKIHWFNFNPIHWNILEEENGELFLSCTIRLEAMKYGHDRWTISPIRDYLNSMGEYSGIGLYDVIFSDAQKDIVLTSTVDNSLESMGLSVSDFAGEPTQDKLFFLSYAEASKYSVARNAGTSSYGFATLNKNFYWTRSHAPYNNNSNSQIAVINAGDVRNHPGEEYTKFGGVVPAMRIKLQN